MMVMKNLSVKISEKIFFLDFEKRHKIAMFILGLLGIFLTPTLNQHNNMEAIFSDYINVKSIALMDSTSQFSGIGLKSTGLGPVIIQSIHIYDKNGNEVQNDSYSIENHFKDVLKNKFSVKPIQQGDTIKPDGEHWILESRSNTPEESQIVRDFLYEMNISVCYCTVENKCRSKNIGLKARTTQINSCT